jgi:hypothetical protein
MASATPLQIPAERLAGLRRYNLIAGVFHLVQAIAIIALSNDFALPVSANYLLDAPVPGARFESVLLFEFPIAIGVAIFSLLSALAHFWIVGPGFSRYANNLANKRNIARWIEYAISSTLMIVLISLINAVWDVVGLVASAALPAVTFTSTSLAKVIVGRLNSHCCLLLLLHVLVESLPDHALLVQKLDLAQLELV